MMKKNYIMILFILFVLFIPNGLKAWNEERTHPDISEIAARNTILNSNYLKNFGLAKGLDEILNDQKVFVWIRKGASLEDQSSPLFPLIGTTRSLNHFHNPLKPFSEAGLDDWFILHYTGESSVLWAQDGSRQQTIVGGDWSWQKTREYFYTALTSLNETAREANFAKTFKGLGHQMHLLQDTAVPDHVRNDAHPEDAVMKKNLSGSKYFEAWAKAQANYINTLALEPLFPSIPFTHPTEGLAPVSQLFDADYYEGLTASATLAQGLAEYTNANFYSGDTIFARERYSPDDRHYFPLPRKTSTDLQSFIAGTKAPERMIGEDGKEDTGIWISKIADGEQIEHFVRPSYLTNAVFTVLGEGTKYYSTFYRDERCHEDYARVLIPRAVGYSAAMIDYFFRGAIEVSLPQKGFYSFSTDFAAGFSKITLLARNTTHNGDEMDEGSIELVARYKIAQEDPFQSRPVPTTETFSYRVIPVSGNIRSIPRETAVELVFDAGEASIVPMNATDVYLQVVYRGKLGDEDDAVAVGFKDISEPTPFDLFNNMDKVCLYGQWYTAGSPEAISRIDTNGNGLADEWDIFPHTTQDVYLNLSTAANPVYASPSEYIAYTPSVGPGTLYRAYFMSDYGDNIFYCSNYAPVVKADPRDPFFHPPGSQNWGRSGSAIKNQVDYHVESEEECNKVGAEVPCDIRYYPLLYPFRGRNLWGPAGFIMDNPKYPEDATCSWESLRE